MDTWPAVELMNRSLSPLLIGISLAAKYIFVRHITRFSLLRTMLADAALNAASLALGIVLVPLGGLAWELFSELTIYRVANVGTFNPVGWAATFCLAVIILALIEALMLWRVFGQKFGKEVSLLCLANAVSVGIAVYSLVKFGIGGRA